MPDLVRKSMEAWTGCLAGALEEDEYRAFLAEAGFEAIELETTRVYRSEDARQVIEGYPALLREIARAGLKLEAVLSQADGKFRSAFIRAVKPKE